MSRRNIIEWFIRNITKDQCYTKFIEYPVIKRRKEIRFVLFVCFPFSLVSLVVGLLISLFIPKKLHNLLHLSFTIMACPIRCRGLEPGFSPTKTNTICPLQITKYATYHLSQLDGVWEELGFYVWRGKLGPPCQPPLDGAFYHSDQRLSMNKRTH